MTVINIVFGFTIANGVFGVTTHASATDGRFQERLTTRYQAYIISDQSCRQGTVPEVKDCCQKLIGVVGKEGAIS